MKSLTLNLGLRYDYYGVPYETSGLMPLPVGGGNAVFGISGRSLDEWMRPGERADVTVIEYVGKNSPNPGIRWYPNDWNNVGPAVGFAWHVPWFGEGKTTVRGGYQMTYQIDQSGYSIVQEINAPGSTNIVSYIPGTAAPMRISISPSCPSLIPATLICRYAAQANAARSPHGTEASRFIFRMRTL